MQYPNGIMTDKSHFTLFVFLYWKKLQNLDKNVYAITKICHFCVYAKT